MALNLLVEALIRTERRAGMAMLTLPGVLAAAMRDDILSFPALRPHQRHAWHAFLVQVSVLAMLDADETELPSGEAAWAALLRRLTPGHADDAPWALVASPDHPALLQSPSPSGTAGWERRETPDMIDMLITARNHDVKRAAMVRAQPDDWLFALVTLQTMEGYGGRDTYGISRMNGGSSSRPCVGVMPAGGPGAHIRRDTRVLIGMDRKSRLADGFAEQGGLALTWLTPWDGQTSLSRKQLHPLYIDVCRRIRLVADHSRLHALVTTSKVRRIAEVPGGVTGDPWAPLRSDKDGIKNLTLSIESFGYRNVVDLLLAGTAQKSALQDVVPSDDPTGLSLVVRGLVRGNSKTDGYHERQVPISRLVRRGFGLTLSDTDAAAARARVELVREMAAALRAAVLVLLANGPEAIPKPTEGAKAKANPFIRRLEARIDQVFFPDLWSELEQEDEGTRRDVRAAWARWMLEQAETVLAEAERGTPRSSALRLRAKVRAQAALHGLARRKSGKLAALLDMREAVDAA